MPPPITGKEALELFHKSEIAKLADLDEATLARIQQLARSASPADTLQPLVSGGFLTRWQADQLLQGKYKRFRIGRALPVGRQGFGRYLILEPLSSIGEAVFLARPEGSRLTVTITVRVILPTDERCEGGWQWWTLGEQPNIIRWCNRDQDAELHYSVCESLEAAQSLALLTPAGKHLPLGEACGCAIQIAKALEAIHRTKPIWDSDAKPAYGRIDPGNVFVWESGAVKIPPPWWFLGHWDFHRIIEAHPEFAAPNQIERPFSVDHRCDCYSLGLVLSHMMGGVRTDVSPSNPLYKIVSRLPGVAVPPALASVITKMTAKKPGDRFQSMTDVIAALRPFVVPAPPGTCPPMAAAALAQLA
ncbi:MAG: hypothetical protein U0792_22960 [Gemmataceae bacterium]